MSFAGKSLDCSTSARGRPDRRRRGFDGLSTNVAWKESPNEFELSIPIFLKATCRAIVQALRVVCHPTFGEPGSYQRMSGSCLDPRFASTRWALSAVIPQHLRSRGAQTLHLRPALADAHGTKVNGVPLRGVTVLPNWPRNRLLLALPSRNLARLMPELEHIACQRAQVLLDADSSLDYVFFPDSGVVSVVAVY